MPIESVKVEQLREFRTALKHVDAELPKEMRRGMKDISQRIGQATRSDMSGGPGSAPHAAAGVSWSADTTGASIKLDPRRAPTIFGVEFGGGKYEKGRLSPRGGTTSQFQAWRGSGADAGYYLYPRIRGEREHIEDAVLELLDRVAKVAFPD